jgi:2',3'-cyclic-nucleotide 2'-phosphodiesterase (5'-nucleotidase family)
VKIFYILNTLLFLIFSINGQGLAEQPQESNPAGITQNRNYLPSLWNETIGSSEIDINRSNEGESLMGNLFCDAMLGHTGADFAFISYGEIYGDVYRGEITRLDMFRTIPFQRTLVTLEISGDTLKKIIEQTLGGVQPGLAISGGKVEYDPKRPSQNRLTFVQVGEYPLYPKKIYRVVTIDYLANGSAGFALLGQIDKSRVFRTGTLLRDLLIDYIRKNSPLDQTKVSIDDRWTVK